MKTVYLHGKLGKRFGSKFKVSADSALEVFSAIEANNEGFLNHLIKSEKNGVQYFVFSKNPNKIKSAEEVESSVISEKTFAFKSKSKEIHIIPCVRGAMPPAFGVFALWTGTIGTASFALTLLGKIVVSVAVSFIVGAIMKSLFKPPKRGEPTTTKSYLMRGSENRTNQGVAVPVGYGTLKIGSTNIGQDKKTFRLDKGGENANKKLESYSSIEYLELLSEGPIEGLVSSDGSVLDEDIREAIFLNGVPIKNADASGNNDGSLNFVLNEEGDLPVLQKGDDSFFGVICENSAMTSEYGTRIYGGSPYADNPDSEPHRESYEKAISTSAGARIVTHYIPNEFVTRVRLTFAAAVNHQNDNGSTSPEEVRFAIKILKDNQEHNILDPASGCIVRKNETPGSEAAILESEDLFGLTRVSNDYFIIKGVCTDNYEFDIVIDFQASNIKSKGVTFKIAKLTNELDPTTRGGNLGGLGKTRRLSFVSATDYVLEKLSYPHSAICKIKFDGKNFNNIPQRAYLAKMKKVLIPSNYNPDTRKYDGPWDGLFRGQVDSSVSIHAVQDNFKSWTDNPAWIYFDIISNARFGVSKYGLDEQNIDKWQLYRIAKYCDELVETNFQIENNDGLPRIFNTENKLDENGNFIINIEQGQFFESSDSSTFLKSNQARINQSDFESEFGDKQSFRGKKIAFFLSSESAENGSDNRKKSSVFRTGEIIIEERTIVSSSSADQTIILKGPIFPESLKISEGVVGACATQINHPLVEPRFTSNIYLTDKMKALQIINNFASVFRGITTYYNGKIVAVQDSFKNPVALFTNSNVSSDGFSYSGISKDQKVTTALVRFNNKDNNFRQDLVVEEDPDAAQKFGYKEEETMGFGITSESQARRLAKWMLFTTQIEIETVSFVSGAEAGYLFPGAIFEVSDEARAGRNKSGRILRIGTETKFDTINSGEITVERPFILLDKDLMQEPFKADPEITVCVGMSDASEEDISRRAPFERRAEDQEAEIESIFTPQILRFKCSLEIGGDDVIAGPQGQKMVATNLELKSHFNLNVGENLFKIFNHDFVDGDAINFESDGKLPMGLSHDVIYYVFSASKHTFKISSVPSNNPDYPVTVEIGDEGEDRMGNVGGQHFILSDKEKTKSALDKVSVGATWSMKGRLAGKGKVSMDQPLEVRDYLDLESQLDVGDPGWFSSSFLGPIYISAFDWIFAPTLGWIYQPAPGTATWLWFSSIQQWVWIRPLVSGENKRHWWYINNIASWLYVEYNASDMPTHAFFYTDSPVAIGETFNIGSLKVVSTGIQSSSVSGNWFSFGSGSSFPSEEPAPQNPGPVTILDQVDDLDNFVQVDIETNGIEVISEEQSIQRKVSVRITLDSSSDKIELVSNGELVFITDSTSDNLNSRDDHYKLLKVDDVTFEIENSGHEASLLGTTIHGGGTISFLDNNVENSDGTLEAQLFRTMTVKELENGSYEITGLEYVPAKFGAIDKKTKVIRPRLPIPPQASMDIPEAPTDLILTDLTI